MLRAVLVASIHCKRGDMIEATCLPRDESQAKECPSVVSAAFAPAADSQLSALWPALLLPESSLAGAFLRLLLAAAAMRQLFLQQSGISL
jgi:hypothetical protein